LVLKNNSKNANARFGGHFYALTFAKDSLLLIIEASL